jgi:hypothetical protein
MCLGVRDYRIAASLPVPAVVGMAIIGNMVFVAPP